MIPEKSKIFAIGDVRSSGWIESDFFEFEFEGTVYKPSKNRHWTTTIDGMENLKGKNRLIISGNTLMYKRYLDDFPVFEVANHWSDVRPSFQQNKIYVVQTIEKVIERSLLMTTDPGDLVFEPTCVRKGTRVWAEVPPFVPPSTGGENQISSIGFGTVPSIGEGQLSTGGKNQTSSKDFSLILDTGERSPSTRRENQTSLIGFNPLPDTGERSPSMGGENQNTSAWGKNSTNSTGEEELHLNENNITIALQNLPLSIDNSPTSSQLTNHYHTISPSMENNHVPSSFNDNDQASSPLTQKNQIPSPLTGNNQILSPSMQNSQVPFPLMQNSQVPFPLMQNSQVPSPLTGRVRVGSLIPIEHLHPGDLVFSHDGKPHRVLRTIQKQYKGTMISIQHSHSPETLWITADHRILCKKRTQSYGAHRDWSHIEKNHFERARELRKGMTHPERRLWSILRNSNLGVKFRKQHPIGPYIVDFYSWESGIVVEVDGDSHYIDDAPEYDRERDAYLTNLGLTVLRFTNPDIESNLNSVGEKIFETIKNADSTNDHYKEWRRADSLRKGDILFFGIDREPVEITILHYEETEEDVFDLEVKYAHSFITEVCAVHNCGSGTTAFVAEQWGRRWITRDTSRVAITLAKQRLMTAIYDYYELAHPEEGVSSGFRYKTVPHITLKSIANNEPPGQEILYDQPYLDKSRARVSGPFTVEAVPAPMVKPLTEIEDKQPADESISRSGETLRQAEWRDELLKSGIRGKKGQYILFSRLEPLSGTRWLHAEGETKPNVRGAGTVREDGDEYGVPPLVPPSTGGKNQTSSKVFLTKIDPRSPVPSTGGKNQISTNRENTQTVSTGGKGINKSTRGKDSPHEVSTQNKFLSLLMEDEKNVKPERVVISFGPEHAPLEQRQVAMAIEEAQKLVPKPTIIVFASFQFDPEAAKDIDETNWPGVTLLKVQMNADLLTDDLKKKRASNDSFWLIGQPDVRYELIAEKPDKGKYHVEVLGFDYYNTRTGNIESGGKENIALWMLDTDYDGRSLFPKQVFFPMAGPNDGWARLAKNLKAEIDEELIESYRGTESLPFEIGKNKRIAVKIIDDRGIESLKIMEIKE